MRMHCPSCNTFLAVGPLHPTAMFRCHQCGHAIHPPSPNAAYFACLQCGLKRNLHVRHMGMLVKCSACNSVSRTDSLYIPPVLIPVLDMDLETGPSVTAPEPAEAPERRTAERHRLHDLSVYLGLRTGTADVHNISETGVGIAIAAPEREFTMGERLQADFYFQQEAMVQGVSMVVVRHTSTVLGCRFDLDDPEVHRKIRLLINQGLLHEHYLRDPVTLEFEKPPGRFQLREHDPP